MGKHADDHNNKLAVERPEGKHPIDDTKASLANEMTVIKLSVDKRLKHYLVVLT